MWFYYKLWKKYECWSEPDTQLCSNRKHKKNDMGLISKESLVIYKPMFWYKILI